MSRQFDRPIRTVPPVAMHSDLEDVSGFEKNLDRVRRDVRMLFQPSG